MQAEYLRLHHCCQRQQVEEIRIVLPNIRIPVLSQTLIVEPIDLCNLTRLMVSPKDGDPILKAHLQSH